MTKRERERERRVRGRGRKRGRVVEKCFTLLDLHYVTAIKYI